MKTTAIFVLLLLKVITINSGYLGECPMIISRNYWGARSPTAIEYCIIPLKYVIVHHTFFKIFTWIYRDFTISAISSDGKVYEGVGWHKVGAHTKQFNTKSIGLAFIGNFTSKLPNRNQLRAAQIFLKCSLGLGEIDPRYKLLGARTISSTQSPGLALFHEIQTWEHFAMVP
ncbi:N-acetylmuramoyl-L-alanine amidase [Popillia japonica]|uniref:N-acetylmuramoyl-L-alanine amidase n=1 Tax=Popillia japonica TaxID=7064 RepID=A0AAW1J1J1_POPJA